MLSVGTPRKSALRRMGLSGAGDPPRASNVAAGSHSTVKPAGAPDAPAVTMTETEVRPTTTPSSVGVSRTAAAAMGANSVRTVIAARAKREYRACMWCRLLGGSDAGAMLSDLARPRRMLLQGKVTHNNRTCGCGG